MEIRNIKRGENTALYEEIKEGNIMGNFNSSSVYKDPKSNRVRPKSQYEVGHYYKYNSLKKWVNSKGIDPMNRTRKLSGNNIKKYKARLITNAPANLPFDPPVLKPRKRTLMNKLKTYTQSQAHKNKQLIAAIKQKDIERIKEYILRNADVNFKLMEDFTPLMLASGLGHVQIVKLLIKAGADINAKDTNRYTALIYAIKGKHNDTIKVLLDAGANINMGNTRNILLIPIEMHNFELVNLLIEKGADLNGVGIMSNHYYLTTPLIAACELGLIEIVKLLIKKGAVVNKNHPSWRNIWTTPWRSPIEIISETGNIEIANILIQSGATLTTDALVLATYNGHLGLVRIFLDNGIDIDSETEYNTTALATACDRGHLDIVRLLLDNGGDVNRIGMSRYSRYGSDSALKTSIKNNNLELATLLIDRGATVNQIVDQMTALTDACEKGNIDIVRLLLDKGADVNYIDKFKQTPFLISCNQGNLDIVRLLIDKGADIHLDKEVSGDKSRAADIACEKSNWDLLKLLKEKGYFSEPYRCGSRSFG